MPREKDFHTIGILIVEDNAVQNQVLSAFLRHEGYQVYSAESIREARTYFTQDLQLILLDLMLPDGSGLDFLKEIREKSQVPVIVMTALEDEFTQLQTFELQADEYVSKPVSPLVMTKRVNALVARLYPECYQKKEEVCGFLLDLAQPAVLDKQGNPVDLTAMEIKILSVLYQHRGKVVSRDFILDYVWGINYVGADRLMDTHIKNIRKKLCPEIIVTVKGIGYRMP